MAAASRGRPRDLIGELRRSPQQFRFFQAVRLLALAEPERCRGDAPLPDNLRFRTPASLAFPASEIGALLDIVGPRTDTAATPRTAETRSPPLADEADTTEAAAVIERRMEVACLGLTGPAGALPTPYTELLIERRMQYRDDSAHAFFDLFSHRSLALLYGAWRKYRFHLAHEQGDDDSFSRGLRAVTGVGLERQAPSPQTANGGEAASPEASSQLPANTLLYYAGLLARRPTSASAIVTLVRGFFGVPAELQQFVGQWVAVPAAEQTQLGTQSARLGESACAGQRVWDQQTKCRMRLGPLPAARYRDFLPGGPGAAALSELLRFCVGNNLGCDLQLVLDQAEVPAPQLASPATAEAGAARLGHSLWLASRSLRGDPDDAVFSLLA